MGLTGILRFLAYRTAEILIIAMLIIHIPHLPPDAKISTPYSVPRPRPFEGTLSLNDKLDDVEIWHKGDFLGPEAFVDYNDQLYTSIMGGDIVKLVGNHITPVVKFGKPCKGVYQEAICGRPLGMDFDQNGILYACDAYYGVYKVDVNTGKKVQLISINQEIEGVKPKVPNSIAVGKNGDFYWTDSSTEFALEDGVFDMFADGSGRVIHYDAKTKKNTVLMKNLHFANGIILSDDEEFLLVAETGRLCIHRYYLNGPKKGTHDIFIDRLPGLPDNLKSDGKGGFLIPLVVPYDKDHPLLYQILGPFPSLRRLLARSLAIIELIFKISYRVWPNEFSERAVHMVGHFTMGQFFITIKRASILHLSRNGEILDSIHSSAKGKLTGISEAHIYKDMLYLGSPFNDFVARIPLKKVGWEHLAREQATPTTTPEPTTTTSTTKPTTTTTKPTTTTAKPTTTQKPTTTTTTPKPTTTTTTQKPTTTTPKPPPTTTTPKVTTTTTTPKPTTTTPKPTTTTPKPTTTTTTPKPTTTTTTPKPTTTTTTPKPTTTTTTPKPTTTTTPKPTTTTPKPTTTTPKPTTTTPKPTTTSPKPTTTTTTKPSTTTTKATTEIPPTTGSGTESPKKN